MAARFWVGGTGTWDASSTTNWSATSGGAGGASAPTTADTVTFDANSGTAATVTVAATATSSTVTINKSDIILFLSGSPTFTGATTLTTGTINLNNNVLTTLQLISSNSNTRVIDFGASGKIVLTGNALTILNLGTFTGLTISGTSLIEANYSGAVGTRRMDIGTGGEANAINVSITAGTDIIDLRTTGGAYRNLNFTGFSGSFSLTTSIFVFGDLTISSGMTVNAVASTMTFGKTSGVQQVTTNGKTLDFSVTQNSLGATLQLQDNLTMGSTRTFTLTAGTLDLTGNSGNWTLSTRLFNSNNSNTRSIAFGTGNITLTGNSATIWNVGSATGWTITGTPTINATYSGSTGTRTITNSASIAEANQVSFNITAGTDAITATSRFRNLNFTGFAGTLNAGGRTLFGNLTFSAGMTITGGANTQTFAATSGTQTITTNGQTIDLPLTFNGIGGTFAFQDALTQGSTRAFTITEGTVQLKNGVTSTVGAFATSGTNQKFLQSTLAGSQATLSQASSTVDASYLTIKDINATGGATWNAFVDQSNIDAGNNDGWDFGISPVIGGAEYTYQLRSFTQPRRF